MRWFPATFPCLTKAAFGEKCVIPKSRSGRTSFLQYPLCTGRLGFAGKRCFRTEDLELFMRLYAKGEMGYTIQEELYAYREDLAAQQRRRYRYRIEEAAVRLEGFARLGLLPKGLLYAAKPLAVGLIPQKLLQRMKDQYYGRRE